MGVQYRVKVNNYYYEFVNFLYTRVIIITLTIYKSDEASGVYIITQRNCTTVKSLTSTEVLMKMAARGAQCNSILLWSLCSIVIFVTVNIQVHFCHGKSNVQC